MAAQDLEKLVVQLSADVKQYERAMRKASGIANKQLGDIERRAKGMNSRLGAAFDGLGIKLAGAFAAAASIQGAVRLVDAATKIQNALKVAGLEGEALDAVYEKLFASAQRNAAPIESLVTLYSRLSLTQKELGVSGDELIGFTDKIALALRVGGTSAVEASGALLQLSQALGGGVVRAEEFNSILEGTPTIAQAAAAGLKEAGGSVAKLRQLVVDGEVSSQAFFRAFEAGAVTLEGKVAGAEATLSQQFVRLQNVLIDTAGTIDDATGASAELGDAIETLADAIQAFGQVVNSVGESDLAKFVGWINEARRSANTFRETMGGLLGILDKMGKINQDIMNGRPITSSIGEEVVQNRIDQAFEGTGADPKTGRLTASPQVKPVSVKDFAVPASDKTGGGKAKSADELQREIQQIKERTDALQAATAAQAGINPLINDYGFALEKAKAKQELMTAAQRAGKEITPQLATQIDALATAYADASVAAEKLSESQDQVRERAQEMLDAQKEVTRGIVDGFLEGKSAADVFADALKNVGNKFLDLAFDAAFDPKTGGIGGLLTGILGGAATAAPTLATPTAMSAPTLPRASSASSGGAITAPVQVNIDARGADREGLARVERQVASLKAELPARTIKTVLEARKGGRL